MEGQTNSNNKQESFTMMGARFFMHGITYNFSIIFFMFVLLTLSECSIREVQAASENLTMQLNDTFFNGTIGQSDEVDFYNFTIGAPGWVTITYQGWNIEDGYYAVLNYDQTTVFESNEVYYSSDTNPKTHSVTLALEAGSYVVKVWSDGNRTGDYKLKGAYQASGNNEKEPNDYFQSAMPLSHESLVTGFFSRTDRIDFYTFSLSAPATVDVTLTSRVHDMYFSVWNKDFIQTESREVYFSSESSPKTSTIQLNLNPGTYYIKCNPYSSNCGRYQIKWTLAPTLVTSISIAGNKTVAAGSSLKLSASIMPSNASNKTLVWSSSNTSVATINRNTGQVSAKAAGSTTITATATDDSQVRASVTLIVSPKQMKKPKGKALGKKSVRIRWSRQVGASQYQVQYAKKSSFKGAKTLSYSNYYDNATIKIKKKGSYSFRVRTVSNINGARLNGKWSKSIKIKVK